MQSLTAPSSLAAVGYEGAREAAAETETETEAATGASATAREAAAAAAAAAAAGAEDEAVAPKQQQQQAAAEMAAVLYFNLNYEGNNARVLAEWLRFQLLQVATPI